LNYGISFHYFNLNNGLESSFVDMEKISRALKNTLHRLPENKVLIIVGARRVGKTELIKHFIKEGTEQYLYMNGEDVNTAEILQNRSVKNYKRLLGDRRLLFLDEAQHVKDIGLILKLMIDEIEGLRIVVTGSSVFDLENKLGEPLTGRSITKHLFPISQLELNQDETTTETRANLSERLRFGSYPEVFQYASEQDKSEYLNNLVSSYLLRDILTFEGLRKPDKIVKLLRLIAYQIGQEVSLSELGNQLGIDNKTVERYLDLLTKVFVLKKVEAFSNNPRKEISKSSRWYFIDNGIRNALIANFNPLALRNDIGQLWENYLFTERLKMQEYTKMTVNNYFWRSYTQQEIDWIEERGGQIHAFEFKWKRKKRSKAPPLWQTLYPEASYQVVDQNNYLEFIT